MLNPESFVLRLYWKIEIFTRNHYVRANFISQETTEADAKP